MNNIILEPLNPVRMVTPVEHDDICICRGLRRNTYICTYPHMCVCVCVCKLPNLLIILSFFYHNGRPISTSRPLHPMRTEYPKVSKVLPTN